MSIKSHIVCLFLLCLPTLGLTQIDTTYQLPQIEVSSHTLKIQPAGSIIDQIDSLYLLGNSQGGFAQILSTNSGLYSKTIAPGSTSSPSIRGAASAHTLILWNGISLTNPMIGQFDLSLFPVNSENRISINYGGNGARWGSGAIGGIVDIRNDLKNLKKLNLKADFEIGSFGLKKGGIRFTQKSKRLQSQTNINTITSANDYPYKLTGGDEKELVNGAYRSINFSEDISYQINDHQKIGLHLLGNNSFRRIPALSTQTTSDAAQNDQNIWLVANWHLLNNKMIYKSRLAFLRDNITYWDHHDTPNPISQFTRTNQWTWEGEAISTIWGQHILELGYSLKHATANAEAYIGEEKMKSAGLFQSFTLVYPKIKTSLIVREEMDDRNEILFLPSIGSEWQFLPEVFLKGRVSRNFHRPSLNDLYWQPGGNPDLKLEHGWSQDIAFSYQRSSKIMNFGTELRLFNSIIHNRILWTFQSGDSFWHPENIGDVNSKGVELKVIFSHQIQKFRYKLESGGNLISSTALQDLDFPRIKAGEQIIYVPREKAFGSLTLGYQRLLILYRFLYNGRVSGINDEIPSFITGGLLLQYKIPFKNFTIKAHLDIDNIWDESYRIIERRPMPGRNISFGFSFNYFKK